MLMPDLIPEDDEDLTIDLPAAVANVASILNVMYDDPEHMSLQIQRICLNLHRRCVSPMLN